MHKYFAKTLFLGKKIEYLPQCHSTNEEMLLKLKQPGNALIEGYILLSDNQLNGRGQRGNVWLSQPGKNLLFSLNLQPSFLDLNNIHFVNVIVSNALQKTISKLLPTANVEIKWPNDIYINDLKVAGVLVESISSRRAIENMIVGIGLNVNQEYFTISTATSLRNQSPDKICYEKYEVLELLITKIESEYIKLKYENYKSILFDYHSKMRWRGELHKFATGGADFIGEIIGINENGRLMVKHNNQLTSYGLKEIEFVI